MSHSLQLRLSGWLFAVIAVTGVAAGALSFVWAWHDANEILDGTLQETASLVTSGQIALPPVVQQLPGSEPDNDVLVLRLPMRGASKAGPVLSTFPVDLPAGLQTVSWQGKRWRVLIAPLSRDERLAVAQQTEVRDEVAMHSAMLTLLPLVLLVPLLLVLVRLVVRRTLEPVSQLARHIDGNPMTNAAALPDLAVPDEVQPFVHSIRRLLKELTEALDRQQQFIANAAHELRSPIAALRIQAGNLETVPLSAEAAQRLSVLQEGIVRIQTLLEQLLSLARSQARRQGDLQAVPLAAKAKEAIAEWMPAAAAKGIDLGMEAVDDVVRIDALPVDVSMLLRNVIGNALKYSPEGAVVNVSALQDGGDAVLIVEDNGPGIAPDQLPKVFAPFYRVLGSGEPGSGLGLSIVAAIAQRLGGAVHLGPGRDGRGLRFEYRQAASPVTLER